MVESFNSTEFDYANIRSEKPFRELVIPDQFMMSCIIEKDGFLIWRKQRVLILTNFHVLQVDPKSNRHH